MSGIDAPPPLRIVALRGQIAELGAAIRQFVMPGWTMPRPNCCRRASAPNCKG
jgi:hypothetical protein